ncbi:MAG TPA: glycosyltransferase family 4 protein [Candidatus Acidoferrum sp.]|nr:glycosyltransferase family 4 protein [Candidatus Acidoferrum sp.]
MSDERSSSAPRRVTALSFFPAFVPPTSGGELRCYHLYKNLGRYYRIDLVTPTSPFGPPETVPLADNVTEHRIPKTWRHAFLQRWFDRIGGFRECSAVVVSLASYGERDYKAVVKELCAASDIVVHEFPFLFRHARKRRGQLLIYDAHNVEFDLQRSMLGGPLGALLSRYARWLESLACTESDVVFATSSDDRRRLIELYRVAPDKVFVAPNGVDVSAVTPVSPAERADARRRLDLDRETVLLFVGSFHPPNIEAVECLVSTLAPRSPDMLFVIAGSVAAALESSRLPENVVCLGRVSDEAKTLLLRAADVALNPMFSGSGTNLKMLEYLAAGVPVVTTPTGARGLDLVSGEHAIVCPIEQFPEHVARVLGDDDLRATLRARGRRLVEQHYDWPRIVEAMHAVIESALADADRARHRPRRAVR